MSEQDQGVLDVLKAARELISVPERWTQGHFARDASGNLVNSSNPAAVCWCVYGATMAAARRVGTTTEGAAEADRALEETFGGDDLDIWNDAPGRTHAEVLDLFDRTIAWIEAQSS